MLSDAVIDDEARERNVALGPVPIWRLEIGVRVRKGASPLDISTPVEWLKHIYLRHKMAGRDAYLRAVGHPLGVSATKAGDLSPV
jgi:hypothetical protein